MKHRTAALAAGLVLVAALTAVTAGVKVGYSDKVDFSALKTYDWRKGTEAPKLITEQRIHKAVDEELKAKGFTRTADSPDFYVVSHATGSSKARLDVNGFGYAGHGWTGWQDFGPLVVNVRDVTRGTLVIDLLDGKTQELIWRGVADGSLGANPNPEKTGKKVFKVVRKMFEDFPPEMKDRDR